QNNDEGEFEGGIDAGIPHSCDINQDQKVSLSELLRVIQFYNLHQFGCERCSEDGYLPGGGENERSCAPHSADYAPQDWSISLSELLRVIQFYNIGGYRACPEGEDGFCPIAP